MLANNFTHEAQHNSRQRLLSKRSDGGYMIIMQTEDARQQRAHVESGDLGGVIPELDSHEATPANPTPVTSRFSPWHACGKDYSSYSKGMNNMADLYLAGVTCRLAPGDEDIDSALDQWKATFGIAGSRDYVQFTNVSMRFLPGMEGQSAGLMDITIAVQGEERLKETFDRARELNVLSGDGWVDMLGVRWRFVKKRMGANSCDISITAFLSSDSSYRRSRLGLKSIDALFEGRPALVIFDNGSTSPPARSHLMASSSPLSAANESAVQP
ncbi:hypothetical protein PABG_05681 [Paracoccidioides brasiliensis Pb03]|nr:hypothetical protein PABG_05681 [Paracoccidioides brasiliensis Pb03]